MNLTFGLETPQRMSKNSIDMPSQPRSRGSLRVATFNIRHCRGMDGDLNVNRTAALIATIGADIVALQEVDRGVRRSGAVDQAARLQELTGFSVHFFPTAEVGGGEFGLAIASAFDVPLAFRLLPKTPFDRRHGAVIGKLGAVTFVATHLSRKPQARTIELSRLWSICAKTSGPKLVLGDFNAKPRWLAPLAVAGVRKVGGFQPTFPSSGPTRQPDHVFVSRELRLVESRTLSTLSSDHLPLIVDLELKHTVGG